MMHSGGAWPRGSRATAGTDWQGRPGRLLSSELGDYYILKGFLLNMNTGGGVDKSRLSSHTAGVLGQLN